MLVMNVDGPRHATSPAARVRNVQRPPSRVPDLSPSGGRNMP